METINTERIGKYLIEIYPDQFSDSPREWDNVTTMICFHQKYILGDKNNTISGNDFSTWKELEELIKENYNVFMIKPLYLYDHSGQTISTSPFPDYYSRVRDSMFIGFVFIEDKQWKLCMGDTEVTEERLNEIINNEVETYDQYIRGDVYGYKIYEVSTCDHGHEHKKQLDSCWGFYGEEDCMNEAKSIVEYYMKNELEKV